MLASLPAVTARADSGPRFRVSPTRSALESLAWPGLGQFESGEELRGMIAMGLEAYLVGRILIEDRRSHHDRLRGAAFSEQGDAASAAFWASASELHRERRGDMIFWTAIVHMFNILDAYIAAHLSEVEEEIDDVKRLTLRCSPMPDGGGLALCWAF